jgi:type I restriction enzyme S subunit
MSNVAQPKLEELMVKRRGSVDPSKFPAETFELFSIPAFDTGEAVVIPGSEIGSSKQNVEPGDLLLSKIVPHIRRAWVVTPLKGHRQIASGEWMIFKHSSAFPGYLRHLLTSDWFHPMLMNTVAGVGGSLVRARPSEIARIEIPLPPLAEQKRIAAILDKADVIRRKLQQSLRLSDDFLRSVFLDMFGDPVTNPKGWPVEPLSEGVESFDGGRNVNPIDADRRDGMRVLKVSAVTSGEYLEAESKSFGEDFDIPADYIVKTGDLLISRANTAELVGAVAYVWTTTGRAMLPDKLWRFVWSKPAKIHPLFMLHMARSEHFRKQLILRATGSSGSMKNIGKVKMLEIPIPLPPIALQNKFAAIVNKTQSKIQKSTAFLQESESLFSTLQQRAFRGEL